MMDAVHRCEGYVAQSTGDGIFGHLKGAPHSPQNFLLTGFSDPQFEQRIDAPANQAADRLCIIRRQQPTSS